MAFIGLLITAYSAQQSAQAAKDNAKRQKNLATFNAQVQEKEAVAKKQEAKFKSRRLALQSKRDRDRLLTQIAASGGVGSPVSEDLAVELEGEQDLLDLLIGFEGETLAKQARNRGIQDRLGGKAATARGRNQERAAIVGAGSSTLQGFNTA